MRTTHEIDRDLLEEAVRVTGAATKSVAVRLGLKALVDEAARRRLAALRGKVPEVAARFTAAASHPKWRTVILVEHL